MQDVSCEPLTLCPSENPQASLDIFSQPHHHPAGFLHPSQGDKQGKTPVLWILFYHGQDGYIKVPPQALRCLEGTTLSNRGQRPRLVIVYHQSSGVLPSRQQYRVYVYPGTPPPSVYQVTHGTAFQAAECYVMHLSCEDGL